MAEFRESVKWFLFFSSYIPLYPILAVRHWSFQVASPNIQLPYVEYSIISIPVISVLWIGLAIVSALVLLGVLRHLRAREPNDGIHIESYRSRNDLITSYILVYIFPFVVLDFTTPLHWGIFATFFFVIGIIQVRSNQLHVNPILALLKYDIYEVDDGDREVVLVTKRGIDSEADVMRTTKMTNGIYVAT